MRDGYTPDELDKIEALMDKLPHLQGMFWADDTGWEQVICELHAMIADKRRRDRHEHARNRTEEQTQQLLQASVNALNNGASRGTSLMKLDSEGGVQLAGMCADISGPILPSPPVGKTAHVTAHVTGPGHISLSELPWQHYTGEGYEGEIKFTVNSSQVTPTHSAPYKPLFGDFIVIRGANPPESPRALVQPRRDKSGEFIRIPGEFTPPDRLVRVGIDTAEHGADESVLGDPIRKTQCAFCSQLSLRQIAYSVDWCEKCGNVVVSEGLERYSRTPELAMETQASIKAANALLDEQEAHAEWFQPGRAHSMKVTDALISMGHLPPPGFLFKRFYADPAELMSENNLEPI